MVVQLSDTVRLNSGNPLVSCSFSHRHQEARPDMWRRWEIRENFDVRTAGPWPIWSGIVPEIEREKAWSAGLCGCFPGCHKAVDVIEAKLRIIVWWIRVTC